MKKTILLALLAGLFSLDSNAQVNERTSTRRDNNNDKTVAGKNSNIMLISSMDQRRIYQWGNGQRATPSGRQADDPTAMFARVLGDSAVVVKRNIPGGIE